MTRLTKKERDNFYSARALLNAQPFFAASAARNARIDASSVEAMALAKRRDAREAAAALKAVETKARAKRVADRKAARPRKK